jgi:hypothetical protein
VQSGTKEILLYTLEVPNSIQVSEAGYPEMIRGFSQSSQERSSFLS